MKNVFDNEELEGIRKKAYSLSIKDGMLEILLGLFFLWYGGFLIYVFSYFKTNFPMMPFTLFFAFSAFIVEAVRRRITYPHIGRFKIWDRPGKTFFAACGGMVMLSGAVSLTTFIRTAQPQEGEVNVQA